MTEPQSGTPQPAASDHEDAVRIVPLWLPEELAQPTRELAVAPAAAPSLTYRGGPILTAVEVVTLFWGAAWSSAQAALAGQMNAFFDFIVTSPLIDQLAEYGTAGKSIRHGRRTATATISSPPPPLSVTDQAIRFFLQHQLSAGKIPHPDASSVYFVFLPPGVTVVSRGSKSCQAFCGYHDAIGGNVFYAVMPYPGCGGCRGSLSVVDALTTTISHELCEAITDPIPGKGWYDDANGEVGDICAWKTKKLGAYTVQLEWSNAKGRCV